MNNLTEYDLGWIAGLIDGEGSISIKQTFKYNKYTYSSEVRASNTVKEFLERLRDLTRLGNITSYQPKNNRKIIWYWRLNTDDQLIFLNIITPYLYGKKNQAELLVEYLNLPSYKKNEKEQEQILIKKSVIYYELRELNKKGKSIGNF